MVANTQYAHIEIRDDGTPVISGTRYKVVDLISQKLAYGWSPEEIQFQHPALTMGQIYSALAYYSDNQETLNLDIAQREEAYQQLRANAPETSLLQKLKSQGLL